MKPKQFDTNIIFRTTKELKEKFKDYCVINKKTVSQELNKYMINVINKEKENKQKE